jgi:hypothetical protein
LASFRPSILSLRKNPARIGRVFVRLAFVGFVKGFYIPLNTPFSKKTSPHHALNIPVALARYFTSYIFSIE